MRKQKYMMFGAGMALALAAATPAQAAIINAPVPTDNYITFGGLDWAWASPCNYNGSGCGYGASGAIDLSYQAGQGWHIPTATEFAARPDESAFYLPNGAVKCASQYFTHVYAHCDTNNGQWNFGYAGGSSDSYSETWLVRGQGAVPEPTTWAMMLAGFGAVGFAMRRRRSVAVSFA